MIGKWRARFFSFVFFILVFKIHGCFCLNSEGFALLHLRMKMNLDSSKALSDWKYDDAGPCSWSGVRCLDGKVHMLNLHGLDLVGSLAPEIGTLSHLKVLDLSKNYFTGSIPRELRHLTALEVLDLRDNEFTGALPAELLELHSLKRLLLSGNRLEGNILPDNEIDGFVPDEVGYTSRKLRRCIRQGVLRQNQKSNSIVLMKGGEGARFSDLFPISMFQSGSYLVDADCNLQNEEDNQVKNTNGRRRVLFDEASNLAAIPPLGAIHTGPGAIPTRSSGSFPAISTSTKISPIPSPGNEGPLRTASSEPSTPMSKKSGNAMKHIMGLSLLIFFIIVAASFFMVCKSRAAKTIRPWKTGLSGQLRKAFITGVPKLNRGELETACEDFSNIVIDNEGISKVYKGTLSSGVEIAVVSTSINSLKDWSKRSELVFRKKIDMFSRMNHKNFINLIGYCEEDKPFTRMMVLEYTPNGSLFEHLHVEKMEHLDWNSRMRIIMGIAYCLQHVHDLNPSLPLFILTSKCIFLTDDYAAKIGDLSFWEDFIKKANNSSVKEPEHSELPPRVDTETNVYCFGILLLEIVSSRVPYSEKDGDLLTWASQYINSKNMKCLVDESLKEFKDNELGIICDVIIRCTRQDPQIRPSMKEVVEKLREEINISPEQAAPRLSPLWWAELEILSSETA